jgi:beta-galactosidase
VDVWAYYNDADEVELFLNGKSLGVRRKEGDQLHVMWRVPYQPGTLKAVSRQNGRVVLTREIHTAGPAAKLVLQPDRKDIHADGSDLSFVTVRIEDADGNLVPHADNMVHFKVTGPGFIAGMDNGSETDHESFKGDQHKAFNGLCLAVIESSGKKGPITVTATSPGFPAATTVINAGK